MESHLLKVIEKLEDRIKELEIRVEIAESRLDRLGSKQSDSGVAIVKRTAAASSCSHKWEKTFGDSSTMFCVWCASVGKKSFVR